MSDKAEIDEIKYRAETAIEDGHEYVGFNPKVVRDLIAALDAATAERKERDKRLWAYAAKYVTGFHFGTYDGPILTMDEAIAAFEEQENVRSAKG